MFKGWDWHQSMIDLAIKLATNKEEVKLLHELLDKVIPTGEEWDWDFNKAQQARALLIRKTEGEENEVLFLEKNLINSEFRKKVIYYARYLFIHSIKEKKPYYDLQKYVVPQERPEFIEKINADHYNQKRGFDPIFIANIYIWEGHLDKLFNLVKQNPSLYDLDRYEEYLITGYGEEITDIYQKAIISFAGEKLGRNHYQAVCRYLKKLIKMGARPKAENTISQLRVTYPQRTALMEEISKIY